MRAFFYMHQCVIIFLGGCVFWRMLMKNSLKMLSAFLYVNSEFYSDILCSCYDRIMQGSGGFPILRG